MRTVLGAILTFALAPPAHADWEGFEWGMTQEQVEAAESQVEVYRLPTTQRKTFRNSWSTLAGIWEKDGHKYRTFFFFDGRGELEFIELEVNKADCSELSETLAERFGDYEEEISPMGPATRTVRYWEFSETVELFSMVVHFPSNDQWLCDARIRNPAPWLNR